MLSYLLCLELGRLAPEPPPRGLLESFGVRVRAGRPDAIVFIPTRVDKAGTLTVKLDLVGGEDVGLPVILAVVMAHHRPC